MLKKKIQKNISTFLFSVFYFFSFFLSKTSANVGVDNINTGIGHINSIITTANKTIAGPVVLFLSGLCTILFLWFLVSFLFHRNKGDDAQLGKDKKNLLWSIIALFILVTIWGIIQIAQGLIGISDKDKDIRLPKICINDACGDSNPSSRNSSSGGGSNSDSNSRGSSALTFNNNNTTTNNDRTATATTPNTANNANTTNNARTNTANTANTTNNTTTPNTDRTTPPNTTNNARTTTATTASNILAIQKILLDAGCYGNNNNSNLDSKFGPNTKAALIKFQKANSLKQDGVLGPLTSTAINSSNRKNCNDTSQKQTTQTQTPSASPQTKPNSNYLNPTTALNCKTPKILDKSKCEVCKEGYYINLLNSQCFPNSQTNKNTSIPNPTAPKYTNPSSVLPQIKPNSSSTNNKPSNAFVKPDPLNPTTALNCKTLDPLNKSKCKVCNDGYYVNALNSTCIPNLKNDLKPIPDSPTYFSVSFDCDGGNPCPTENIRILKGNNVKNITQPKIKDGYVFSNWVTRVNGTDDNSELEIDVNIESFPIEKDTIFKAKWKTKNKLNIESKQIFSVSFDCGDGAEEKDCPNDIQVREGEIANSPEIKILKTNYIFDAWIIDLGNYGRKLIKDFPIKGNITFKASYKIITSPTGQKQGPYQKSAPDNNNNNNSKNTYLNSNQIWFEENAKSETEEVKTNGKTAKVTTWTLFLLSNENQEENKNFVGYKKNVYENFLKITQNGKKDANTIFYKKGEFEKKIDTYLKNYNPELLDKEFTVKFNCYNGNPCPNDQKIKYDRYIYLDKYPKPFKKEGNDSFEFLTWINNKNSGYDYTLIKQDTTFEAKYKKIVPEASKTPVINPNPNESAGKAAAEVLSTQRKNEDWFLNNVIKNDKGEYVLTFKNGSSIDGEYSMVKRQFYNMIANGKEKPEDIFLSKDEVNQKEKESLAPFGTYDYYYENYCKCSKLLKNNNGLFLIRDSKKIFGEEITSYDEQDINNKYEAAKFKHLKTNPKGLTEEYLKNIDLIQ